MPPLKPYKLSFKGGLHLGTRGINLAESAEFIPSDTLFSALLDVWNRLGEDVAEFVEPYEDANPPFLLTSAFPFAGGVRFFPMPADLNRIFKDKLNDKDWRKNLRKIRYFSEGLLRKALAGDVLDLNLFPPKRTEKVENGVALQKGQVWLLKDEVKKLPKHLQEDKKGNKRALKALYYLDLWKNGEVPRVTIDRIAQTSTLYHAGRVSFAEECGLWFGVQWNDESGTYPADFLRCLENLQYEGLGGERSSGYGAFEYKEEKDFSLPSAKSGEAGYTLSRYHPTKDELPDALSEKNAAYKLVNVGGWLHTHAKADQRRKKLWMLEAGSIIQVSDEIQGSLTDTKPKYKSDVPEFPHPVWRYGFALPIKFAEVK
jgi:CRISPR-associated protein Csm4